MLLVHLRTILSFAFYHQLSFAKKGLLVAFGVYLFLLSALMAYFAQGAYLNKNVPLLLKNFPEVTFEKGVLVAPEKPVSVSWPGDKAELIFDAAKDAIPPQSAPDTPLIWVNNNLIYIFANNQVQKQILPSELTFTTSQENLSTYQNSILISLRLAFFVVSLFLIIFLLCFSFCLAFSTAIVFRIIRRIDIPYSILARWSFFLLGPLSVLWYIRLWINIPLFSLAQVILCIIYMQQIFNFVSEVPPHAH